MTRFEGAQDVGGAQDAGGTQDQAELFEGRALACERGERLVFAGLDFDLRSGEALILTGANGSGKSSLLRLMAGLLKPAAGWLCWDGRDLSENRDAFLRDLQFVGHLEAVKPVLSLSENLTFWAGLRGGALSGDDLLQALAAFGLKELAELPARYLSAGQQRRLALSRLLVGPSRLWLLDEPTVGLDSASVEALVSEIEKHRARGGCLVIATHQDLPLKDPRRLDMSAAAGAEAAA